MNLPTKFIPSNTFNSSGSKFTILLRKDNLLLSEQRIEGKLVAYEVTAISIKPLKVFKDGKWYDSGELTERFPSAQAFGKGYDKSFSPNSLNEAKEYFDSCVP